MLKIVRANGWDRNLDSRSQSRLRSGHNIASEFDAKYTFYDLGYNLRPTEITGFLGRIQLKHLNQTVEQRERNFEYLLEAVASNPDLVAPDRSHIEKLSSFGFPVICKSPDLRHKYVERFTRAEVEIRPLIAGNIQKQPFFKKYVSRSFDLPGADFLHQCGFYCGIYPELSQIDLEILRDCLSVS